jgi:hypothetical protein
VVFLIRIYCHKDLGDVNTKRFGVLTGAIAGGLLVLICLTPFSPGLGGRACGPERFNLYRFVQDDIGVLHGHHGWEVFRLNPACRQHDTCYARASASRRDCDDAFMQQMSAVCETGQGASSRAYCTLITRLFYGGVRVFGWMAYDWDDWQRPSLRVLRNTQRIID